MADFPLVIFATANAAIPLVALRDLLLAEGLPASFGVDIAGDASDEQLNAPGWESAILRWLEPELHEVAILERMVRDEDEEAEPLILAHQARIADNPDVAGRMIIADHLERTRIVTGVQLLPALLIEDSHDAWGALDILLRFLAHASDGVIYAEAEGYCDADGELILPDTDVLNSVDVGALEE
jgi:hypothetical protein